MTKIKPLADRILLKWVSWEKTITDSWIYLPQTDKKDIPFLYEVVEVWPWTKEKPVTVKIWEKVLCGQYSGDEIKIEEQNYKIVANDYILAIIED